ncbi:MAG: citryl-CoA lyase [Candidatus Thermoplasmatota archaeon]
MRMTEELWGTSITHASQNKIVTKGYRQDDLIGRVSFAGLVHLLLKGELPTDAQERMIDAILAASIDHGVTPPSALAARIVASGGVPLPTAVAAGLLSIGDAHGGAIEQCARLLQEAVQEMRARGTAPAEAAKAAVTEKKARKERIPGYGHRLHTADPRTARLLSLAHELGIAGDHIAVAQGIEMALGEGGKALPLNVDGAIAAVISDMGFDWRVGKGFFLIGRSAGLVAHVYEETQRYKPMRRVAIAHCEYDGPAERDLQEGRG